MITDPLFYRLFETSPETFFLLMGLPVDSAKEMASRYQYQAIEFKETAHRADGVLLPKEPDLPLYVARLATSSVDKVLQPPPRGFHLFEKCRGCIVAFLRFAQFRRQDFLGRREF